MLYDAQYGLVVSLGNSDIYDSIHYGIKYVVIKNNVIYDDDGKNIRLEIDNNNWTKKLKRVFRIHYDIPFFEPYVPEGGSDIGGSKKMKNLGYRLKLGNFSQFLHGINNLLEYYNGEYKNSNEEVRMYFIVGLKLENIQFHDNFNNVYVDQFYLPTKKDLLKIRKEFCFKE